MSNQLELSLYDNGMDSIRHGLEHYISDTDEKRRYKFAILHISQGVMLLLKERLRLEHPNFIFTNVEVETKTVDVDTTLKRLKQVAKIELSERDERVIRDLAELRNKIEHFELTLSKSDADSVISRLVPFLANFTQRELGKSFEWEIGRENWQALLSTQEYRLNAIRNAESLIRAEGLEGFFCPDCQANTASRSIQSHSPIDEWTLDFDEIRCRVCNYWVVGLVKCRQCGKEIEHKTLPQYVCYCEDCAGKLQQDFPEFQWDTPTLFFIGELRRWFGSHDEILGEQLLHLLRNVKGPGSSYYSPVLIVLQKRVIDFDNEHSRRVHDTLNTLISLSPNINSYDRFKWTYPVS